MSKKKKKSKFYCDVCDPLDPCVFYHHDPLCFMPVFCPYGQKIVEWVEK